MGGGVAQKQHWNSRAVAEEMGQGEWSEGHIQQDIACLCLHLCITNPQEAVNPELEELKVQTRSKTALLQVRRGNLTLTWRSRHITHGKAVGRPEPQQSEAVSHSWRVEAVPSQEAIQKPLRLCVFPVRVEKSCLGERDVMFYPYFLKLLLAVTSVLWSSAPVSCGTF